MFPDTLKSQDYVSVRMVVTPELAEQWLEYNAKNRPLVQNTINRHSAAMIAGNWMFTGEAIIFDTDGMLLNGQHRLWAVIESKKKITTAVSGGIHPDAFKYIDIGRKRTGGDTLAVMGEKNYTNLAASCRLLELFRLGVLANGRGPISRGTITNDRVVEVLMENPHLRDTTVIATTSAAGGVLTVSEVSVLYYLFQAARPEMVETFFTGYKSGANLEELSPILKLRYRLDKLHTDSNGERDKRMKLAITIKAWNAFLEGRAVSRITWNPGKERFPTILS